ncbi:hypothetical protein [Kutzneria sp. NPDC051319]|uniref:hypothetical protein n=1 Tax=Kutzneria sp. NPDC051319 TaxID=3155047 RepID=UPI003436095D
MPAMTLPPTVRVKPPTDVVAPGAGKAVFVASPGTVTGRLSTSSGHGRLDIGVLPQAAVNNPAAATAARARVIVNMGLSFRVT